MMFALHLDAARSRAIGSTLHVPLSELRRALTADVAYLMYQREPSANYDIVSLSCEEQDLSFLPGETVTIRRMMSLHLPRSFDRLRIDSKLRGFANLLTSALVVPWRHSEGRAWLVVGSFSQAASLENVSSSARALDLVEALKRSYLNGAVRGARTLDKAFKEASRRLLDAERGFDTTTLLNSIAAIARWLFDTSSAYVALPSAAGDKFNFVATERIHTREFRTLSLGIDEGIGGLARRCRMPVRTTDYAQDSRLERAPRQETWREGFKSAACTPLWRDGDVNGLLYIADRDYRAFNDIDLNLLEQFANRSAEALTLDQWRHFHDESTRRSERDRLANKLHDNVVRHLLDVGITASLSSMQNDNAMLRNDMERIQQSTQMCLDAIRACISEYSFGNSPVAIGIVAAQLEALCLKGGLSRAIKLGADCKLSAKLSADVASALIIIGNEALSNADRHSNGHKVAVRIDKVASGIRLRVEDDGQGVVEGDLSKLLDRPGHLGLQRMRNVAQSAGGSCSFRPTKSGGLCVEASLPFGI